MAVVGATGAVGEVMLASLHKRQFPIGHIYALASEHSAGNTVSFGNKSLIVEDLASFDFSKVQIGLFSAGASVSKIYAPIAADAGCIVIDNTSAFRYDDDIPLIVPEVNAHAIADYSNTGIIANPNCSTIQMVVALKPIYDAVGIVRINVATYQAVSGSGKSAVDELVRQTTALLNGRPLEANVYPKQIAFNVLPHIDKFADNGYTWEEMKMVRETKKIMGDDTISINPTAVRVPVFYGHSEAIHLETREKLLASDARNLLASSQGIAIVDDHVDGGYPTAVTDGSGTDSVYIGRIREDISHPNGLNFWVVADNLRKGAALNSIQIAEKLIEKYL